MKFENAPNNVRQYPEGTDTKLTPQQQDAERNDAIEMKYVPGNSESSVPGFTESDGEVSYLTDPEAINERLDQIETLLAGMDAKKTALEEEKQQLEEKKQNLEAQKN